MGHTLDPGDGEPGPPFLFLADAGRGDQVGGGLELQAFAQVRRTQRREHAGHQQRRLQPWPLTRARADGDVGVFAAQVDQVRRGIDPDRQAGIGDLEPAQPCRQPLTGQGGQGRDRQHAFIRIGQVRQGATQDEHGLGGGAGQPLARLRRLDLARQAAEQAEPQSCLQRLDLPADGRLGHAEFVGGPREALEAGRRLEDADRSQGKAGERIWHKSAL